MMFRIHFCSVQFDLKTFFSVGLHLNSLFFIDGFLQKLMFIHGLETLNYMDHKLKTFLTLSSQNYLKATYFAVLISECIVRLYFVRNT